MCLHLARVARRPVPQGSLPAASDARASSVAPPGLGGGPQSSSEPAWGRRRGAARGEPPRF
eukprot:2570654-Lingulodinium_polyedra.AAC.1